MDFGQFIILYLLSAPIFFAIDMVWLGVVARNFYQRHLGYLLGPVNWPAAIGFYLIYLVGVTLFASYPGAMAESAMLALGLGAAFGFFTYATYDMTNWATVRDWPAKVVVVDILWGTVLGASVAGATTYLYLLWLV